MWRRNNGTAHVATTSDLPGDTNDVVNTSLTNTQYKQLMHLLQRHEATAYGLETNDNTHAGDTTTALLAGTFCLIAHHTHTWIVDSGVSDHMTFDLSLFESYHSLGNKDHTITIPDSRQISVQCIGTVLLPNGLRLKGVLYVPHIHFNLISTHKLCHDLQCSVIFDSRGCFVQDLSMKEPWLLGKLQQGLYYVDNLTHAPSGPAFTPSQQSNLSTHQLYSSSHVDNHDLHNKANLWHLRLGHMPFHKLKLLFPISHHESLSSHYFCRLCPMAKQTRLYFPHSVIKTSYPMELLHVDIWGPYRHKTRSGCNMFLTIVDDFTRTTWLC